MQKNIETILIHQPCRQFS